MDETKLDTQFMRMALALAERGRYSTSPNPAVGCVIVRDGTVIGEGFHVAAGQPHAEVVALRAAGHLAAGATAYVTLEPCNHHGRTGPCAEALIQAKIARVIYAVDDPGPASSGGAARLREAGIAVRSNVCSEAASWLNRGFLKRMRCGRPWVRVKIGMSLDGKIAMASGESQWITGQPARADVQRLRAESCAVMTGIETVLADDPSLNVRDSALNTHDRQPQRIVLDGSLRMPPEAKMLKIPGDTHILTTSSVDKAERLVAAGANVKRVKQAEDGHVSIEDSLDYLGELQVNHVLVEAGSTLVRSFMERELYDEIVVYVAPKILGSDARAAFSTRSALRLADVTTLELTASWQVGNDVALAYIRAHETD